MAVTLGSTGITFSSGVTQTTIVPDYGALIGVSTFTTSGTWTNPGATKVVVKLVGGGGGGAGYCESGGAGGYAEGLFNVAGVASVTVTVGAGGAGVGYYAAGGRGGTSSFGTYCSANGGHGANTSHGHTGGYGGIGVGGQVLLRGGGGSGHSNNGGTNGNGRGGASYFGGPASLIRNHTNISATALPPMVQGAPGTGGPGQMTAGHFESAANNPGKAGIVIIYAFK